MSSYKLRRELRLEEDGDTLSLADPSTCRRFTIPRNEAPIVELLRRGVEPSALDAALQRENIDATAAEYAEIYRALKLLDGSAGSDVQKALRSELQAQMLDALRTILAYARSSISYYRERYATLDEAAIRTLSDFARVVPLLSRDEYRANFPDRLLPAGSSYLAVSTDPRYRIKMSAGTTAERVQVLQPVDYLAAVFCSSFLHKNVFAARHAIFGPLRCMEMDCFTETPAFEQRYLGNVLTLAAADVMRLDPSGCARLLGELTETGITNVVANPFYLAYTTWLTRKIDRALPTIRDLHLGYDYVQVTTRAFLSREYGCPALDIYGMTEGGFQLMRSCPLGSIHLNEEFFAFEFLPELAGVTHRLVFTTLRNDFLPLIRYETTDLFQWDAERELCECGSPLRRVQHIDGRLKELVTIDGRSYPLGVVDRAIGEIDGVAMYQLRVRGRAVELRYLGFADEREIQPRISAALTGLFGAPLNVTVRSTESFTLGRSGKFDSVERV